MLRQASRINSPIATGHPRVETSTVMAPKAAFEGHQSQPTSELRSLGETAKRVDTAATTAKYCIDDIVRITVEAKEEVQDLAKENAELKAEN